MQTLKKDFNRKNRRDFRKCNDPASSEDIQDTEEEKLVSYKTSLSY